MIENLPLYVSVLFILTTFLTVWIFWAASGYSKLVIGVLIFWLLLQALVSYNGFYTNTNGLPPRFVLLPGPALLVIILLFITKAGRKFIDTFNIQTLTWLHTIRIAVEVILLLLFLNKAVPKIMTFEGRNFDILAGLSAPVIAYYGYHRFKLSKATLITWNLVCIAL